MYSRLTGNASLRLYPTFQGRNVAQPWCDGTIGRAVAIDIFNVSYTDHSLAQSALDRQSAAPPMACTPEEMELAQVRAQSHAARQTPATGPFIGCL